MWAALSIWPEIAEVDLIERDDRMLELGKKLALRSPHRAIRNAKWIKADAASGWLPDITYDLVIMAYVLGELQGERNAVVERLWRSTGGMLVIVEPGTPAAFGRLRQVRDELIVQGAKTVAPCPHNAACPMNEDDWCHFSERVSRSRIHRQLKSGELGYEDEKFSFIAVARSPALIEQLRASKAASGRILRHPQFRHGHVKFQVCTPDGIRQAVVTRKNKELYRKARDAKWGALLPG
jgi:ribosomal protein RSM22 (predicted rRNA methylase)